MIEELNQSREYIRPWDVHPPKLPRMWVTLYTLCLMLTFYKHILRPRYYLIMKRNNKLLISHVLSTILCWVICTYSTFPTVFEYLMTTMCYTEKKGANHEVITARGLLFPLDEVGRLFSASGYLKPFRLCP